MLVLYLYFLFGVEMTYFKRPERIYFIALYHLSHLQNSIKLP